MASLPLWLTYQEMMPMLPKGQPFSGDERRAPEKWQVVSSLEHPDNWERIITRLSSADLRRCKLTVGNRSKFTLPAVLFLAAAGAGTVFWMTQPEPDVGPTAEEIAARARLQFKKPEPPPELPHPWASQPVISDFLKACADLRKPSPVALEGWKLTRWNMYSQRHSH